MLQVSYIRENKDQIINGLKKRNFKELNLIDEVINLDSRRRELQHLLDEKQAERNKLSKEVGMLFKNKEIEKANQLKEKSKQLGEEIDSLALQNTEYSSKVKKVLLHIPNQPHELVVKGKSEEDNELVFSSENSNQNFSEGLKPHWDLTEKYNLVNFELGVKISGAGFPVFLGKGAKLQRALINFFLDFNENKGYNEVNPPHLINEQSGYGTGQLPDKEGQMYHVQNDDLYLIPTAEVPVTNIYRDVIIDEEYLPIKNTAYTPCFRREAGSYGKDVRGLNRLHQFDKVEIVRLEKPENSYSALDEMVDHVKELLNLLELPFRIVRLCGGDLGFTSAMTYDFEVYSAGQKRWLEVSSVSNFENFQANRLKLRFREKGQKPQLCHTLNGSSLALPRIIAALIENNQTEDGILIPKALHTYTGFEKIN